MDPWLLLCRLTIKPGTGLKVNLFFVLEFLFHLFISLPFFVVFPPAPVHILFSYSDGVASGPFVLKGLFH